MGTQAPIDVIIVMNNTLSACITLMQGRCMRFHTQGAFLAAIMPSDALLLSKNSDLEEALISFEKATRPPSIESCVSILQHCRQEKNLVYDLRAHKVIFESNLHKDSTLGSYIVAMFAESGSMVHAQISFDYMNRPNDFAWTYLLQGYNNCGEPHQALALLPKLKKELFCPSSYTYHALLKSCVTLKSIEQGLEIHAEVVKEGLESELHVGSLLVDLYAKCGLLADAQEVFDDFPDRNVVVWSSLVAGYANHGFGEEVMNCIVEMRRQGASPNSVTFICGLKGCKSKVLSQKIHIEIAKCGFDSDTFVGNTLVDIYAKTDALQEACWVFVNLPLRCIISWTALIDGHVNHNASEEALMFFRQMQKDGVVPDANIFACMLKACGDVGAMNSGQNFHALIVKQGYHDETYLGIALVDMYGKCGLLFEAQDVFHKLPCQDLILWSALLTGHAFSGETVTVFRLFTAMVRGGVQPDRVVFLNVLTACARAGLIEIGSLCFQLMLRMYGICQGIEHYNCLVDLVGRAGQLHAAVAMLDAIPVQPNLVTWMTLLGACQNQSNVELGQNALEYALKLHKKHTGSLLLAKQILRWE